MNIWKIATINTQGLNDTQKFDEVMNWIIHNNLDTTILTETKLRLILTSYNFKKYQKNYTSHWSINPEHTKSTGVAIITKKSSIGKHQYKTNEINGRLISIHHKFKGKHTVIITGIYGPAAKNEEAKCAISAICNTTSNLTSTPNNTHN